MTAQYQSAPQSLTRSTIQGKSGLATATTVPKEKMKFYSSEITLKKLKLGFTSKHRARSTKAEFYFLFILASNLKLTQWGPYGHLGVILKDLLSLKKLGTEFGPISKIFMEGTQCYSLEE